MSSHLEYNIGQIPFQDQKWPCGVAYICLHSDIDRDIFIADCFVRSTVSIRTQEGSVYKNCPIDPEKFNYINWPEDANGIGTPIVYVTEPVHQQPIVISVLSFTDQIVDQQENQFKLKRKVNNSIVEISGSAKEGYLNILVDGVERSDFIIKVANKGNKGNLILDVDGKVSVLAQDTIELISQKEIVTKVGIEDKSTTTTQNASELNHHVDKFSVNKGTNSLVLGDVFREIFDNFIETVSKSTVTTGIGQMPLLNAVQIASFKAKTEQILSKISFTD